MQSHEVLHNLLAAKQRASGSRAALAASVTPQVTLHLQDDDSHQRFNAKYLTAINPVFNIFFLTFPQSSAC